ncbi:dipeptidyl peptidase IV protein [Ancylostoma ceylanicum]|uniref:Dipeptidyl peptidase IV protein n=1 Tax=Ancylostoma ceylanicum TaxID=53326 RepID=A0A0D6LUD0_9BILA|nr:dipeptidyl peptidase IV protein [Ancylostoma ceylanicum]
MESCWNSSVYEGSASVNLNGSATQTPSDDSENRTASRLQFRRRPTYRKFTFEDLFSGKVFLKDSYTTGWTRNGGLIQTKDEFLGGTTVATVIHPGTFDAVDYLSDSTLMHSLSSNEKYAFVSKNIKQIFRHSNEELFEISRMINGTPSERTFPVGPKGDGLETILTFEWNPNINKNDFVFVHEYNIYYQLDPEKPGTVRQLTDDGGYLLRYGVPDWLYEEEILSSGTAIWWSESGQHIAYIRSYYIFSNTWLAMPANLRHSLGEERLFTAWATREQNLVYITLCNEIDCVLTHVQSFTVNGRSMWAEPADFKNVFASKSGFFLLLPHAYNDGNIYNHIAHMQIQSNIVALSSFLPDCDYGTHEVSPNGKRAVMSCIKPFQNTKMYIMDVEKPSSNKLLEGAEEAHIPFDLPELSYEIVKLPSGYEVHIGIMKPPKFDPTLKYPLLVDVYGGPNSCKVRQSTPNPNMIHFCSTLGAVVAWIDGRGSSNRGWNLKAPVYKALGQFETIDTIDAVKYLTEKYSFIEKEQVAVFGWSYGGFLSTHVAMRDQGETFKCAVAVAPVVDFMLYGKCRVPGCKLSKDALKFIDLDSAYTERYLGIPLENPAGYNNCILEASAPGVPHDFKSL